MCARFDELPRGTVIHRKASELDWDMVINTRRDLGDRAVVFLEELPTPDPWGCYYSKIINERGYIDVVPNDRLSLRTSKYSLNNRS